MFEQSVSFTIQNGLDFPLPNMVRIQQHFNDTRIDDPEKAKQLFPDALLEHASIEDIMIALCEGRTPPLSTAGNNAERRMTSS